VHGSLFFMGRIYHNLLEYGLRGTPPWFYAVFAAVKLAPATFLFALAGLAVALTQRRPAHKLLLSWLAVWFIVHSVSGSKWGRFFVSVLPAFLILAGWIAALAVERVRMPAPRWAALAAAALLLPGGEAAAAVAHAPHYRLYISPLAGGDAQVPVVLSPLRLLRRRLSRGRGLRRRARGTGRGALDRDRLFGRRSSMRRLRACGLSRRRWSGGGGPAAPGGFATWSCRSGASTSSTRTPSPTCRGAHPGTWSGSRGARW